jgi:hypothetical protein
VGFALPAHAFEVLVDLVVACVVAHEFGGEIAWIELLDPRDTQVSADHIGLAVKMTGFLVI